MTAKAGGRFTQHHMAQTMVKVAVRIGADPIHAELLRLTNSAVFALPSNALAIRIGRSRQFRDRAARVARLGAWFNEIDVPTIRPAAVGDQPIAIDGLAAIVWRYTPASKARELKMVAAAVPLLRSGPGVANEFRKRLRSALSGDKAARSTPFADVDALRQIRPASGGSERVG